MEKAVLLTTAVVALIVMTARSDVYVAVSFDVETDLPPVLNTSRGLDELDYLLDFLESEGVKATFFTTSKVLNSRPELAFRILKDGHELAGHSATHANLSALSYQGVLEEVSLNVFDITFFNASMFSFRPPYNQPGNFLMPVLEELGVRVESSYNGSYPYFVDGVLRVTSQPLFYPSTVYPRDWVEVFEETLNNQDDKLVKVVVVNLHPWELVDMPSVEGYEEYTIPSGDYSWTNLKNLVARAKSKHANFVTMKELYYLFK